MWAVHGSLSEAGRQLFVKCCLKPKPCSHIEQPLCLPACIALTLPAPPMPIPQAVVAGAHEQSMAAAEEASKALHSGGVPKDTPGMGDAVGACFSSRERLERSQRPLTYCMLHRAVV